MRQTRFVSLWGPVLFWMGLIFALSSVPNLRISDDWIDFVLRKCAHVFEFAVLAALLIRALGETWPEMPAPRILGWSALIALLYAVSDEVHQKFVPLRGASVIDVGVDAIGVLAALRWGPPLLALLRLKK